MDEIITDWGLLLKVQQEFMSEIYDREYQIGERGENRHDDWLNNEESNPSIDDGNDLIPTVVDSEVSAVDENQVVQICEVVNEIEMQQIPEDDCVDSNHSTDDETTLPSVYDGGSESCSDGILNVDLSSDDMPDGETRTALGEIRHESTGGDTRKLFVCGVCKKEFAYRWSLMKHSNVHTRESKFKCEVCGKGFPKKKQLNQHLLIHTPETKFKCETCGEGFHMKKLLFQHRRNRHAEERLKCDTCGIEFSTEGSLTRHRLIHLDARPYVCDICDKGFNSCSTLRSHKKTHIVGRPHKCLICCRAFIHETSLRNHMFLHANQRRYECEDCGEGFNDVHVFRSHRLVFHSKGENAHYKCCACGQEFLEEGALKYHEEFVHNIKRPPGPVTEIDTSLQTQMVVPVSVEDMRMAKKVTMSPHINFGEGDISETEEIDVPIVAAGDQNMSTNGHVSMHIASPASEPCPLPEGDEEHNMSGGNSLSSGSLVDDIDLILDMDDGGFNLHNYLFGDDSD